MYPTNWQPSSSSSSIDESVQQYWNNHHQNKILNSSTAAVTYDPLLYPQNYMKNMFGAAAAAVGQWVDSSNTYFFMLFFPMLKKFFSEISNKNFLFFSIILFSKSSIFHRFSFLINLKKKN